MPLKFANVAIRWDRDVRMLAQLDESTASSEDGILLNHMYSDYRGMTIQDAVDALQEEADLLRELSEADWDTEESDSVIDAYIEAMGPTSGLDAGVAGLVYALSAIGATPISSCNGGLVGVGSHDSDVPHVLFTASPPVVDMILAAAKKIGVGVIKNDYYAEAFADHLPKLHALAHELVRVAKDNSV